MKGPIDNEPQMLTMDGFDEAVLGTVETADGTVICYDRDQVISILEAQGMEHPEAVHYHWFNQAGAYMGPGTPVFLDRQTLEEIQDEINDL